LKFLFITIESLAGDLAWAIRKEGHEVKYFIRNEDYKDVHDGFVDKVNDWREHTDWADVIIFDDIGYGKEADELRQAGKLVVGGGVYTEKLEENRGFGQTEMKRLGIKTLQCWDFNDFEALLTFLKDNPGRYVFKPSDDLDFQSPEKDLIYIGQDESGQDLYEIIKSNKKYLTKIIRKFQLQEYASGVEISSGAFFNGKKFIYPISVGFEHKRLFPNNIGPLTGEMGTLHYFDNARNKIFRATTARFEKDLANSGYIGFIDINCMVNESGIYPLEFTCRFGYPYISIQMEGIDSKFGEFFYKLAKGEDQKLKINNIFQVGVVCCVPPFPYDDKTRVNIYKDLSIIFKKPNLFYKGIHLGDVKIVDDVWRIAGDAGYVLVIAGSAPTVSKARKLAYDKVNRVLIQNMYYRNDIGASWTKDRRRLKKWGYI